MPNVSVIIPAYNCRRFLGQTLDSVLAQTYQDWECLVVDDASTDDTAALAQAYAERDPRIRVHRIKPEEKTHYPGVRNVGLAHLRGRWVAPLDGDDWWEPGKLARQVEESERRPGIVLCSNPALFWREGKIEGRTPWAPTGRIGRDLPVRCVMSHCSVLVDRQAMLAVGAYDPAMHHCEDWDLWLRLLWRYGPGSMIGIDEPLTYYRRHGGNNTNQIGELNHFEWLVARKTLRRCGWGFKRPVLAWRVVDARVNDAIWRFRQAKRYGPALGLAGLAVILRPVSPWRWKQLTIMVREAWSRIGRRRQN